jgi:hypothetical protein
MKTLLTFRTAAYKLRHLRTGFVEALAENTTISFVVSAHVSKF